MKDWFEIIKDKDFSRHRISFLLVGCVAILSFSKLVLIPLVTTFFTHKLLTLGIITIGEVSFVVWWYYHRTNFPKGNLQKQNIVIAITTEDANQKVRIKNDFADEVRKQLFQHGLDDYYDVIVLHNHLAKSLRDQIRLWYKIERSSNSKTLEKDKFNKVTSRLNAKFFVYGDLIKRNGNKGTYRLDIDALILHQPTDQINTKSLASEFSYLWKREITFLEEEELNGFKSNAEHIFFTAMYMIGLATFVDNRFERGIHIWEILEEYVIKKNELSDYRLKIIHLKGICFFLLSRLYYLRNDISRSITYREKYLKITPNEYDKHLTEALRQIKLRGDLELALAHVEKAKKISKGDGTWRYSKFYLLIRKGEMKKALGILDEINSRTYLNELDAINQVISYNIGCVREDNHHIQSYFIIGTLLYKKLGQPLEAYERLDKFIKLTYGINSWIFLNRRARVYLHEIDKLIGIQPT